MLQYGKEFILIDLAMTSYSGKSDECHCIIFNFQDSAYYATIGQILFFFPRVILNQKCFCHNLV